MRTGGIPPKIRDDRAAVLAALRESDVPPLAAPAPPTSERPRPADRQELVRQFTAAAERNAATVARIASRAALPAAVADYLRSSNAAPRIVYTPPFTDLDWAGAGLAGACRPPADSDPAGLTGVEAAAADTGALLLESSRPQMLTLSLLPPLHVAVLYAGDIVADLGEIFKHLRAGTAMPRLACLSCGPSRTADIEQELTLAGLSGTGRPGSSPIQVTQADHAGVAG